MPVKLFALSIKQPWAWCIIHAGKNIENRTQASHYRGPLFIHASKGWDAEGYRFLLWKEREFGIQLPEIGEFKRGGIIGKVDMIACINNNYTYSKWYSGPYGYVFENARPFPFMERDGQLGIFRL